MNKKGDNKKILIIGILLMLIILLAGIEGSEDNGILVDELNNLTSCLTDEGYEWLVDYSIGGIVYDG